MSSDVGCLASLTDSTQSDAGPVSDGAIEEEMKIRKGRETETETQRETERDRDRDRQTQ